MPLPLRIDAERRARDLLAAAAGPEALAMYLELGFVALERGGGSEAEYGYLIYPQRPIVAYDARSGEPLSELCVKFRDGAGSEDDSRLPEADDVLAKWLALSADERGFVAGANLDRLGRQRDPAQVRRDLTALASWRARRAREKAPA